MAKRKISMPSNHISVFIGTAINTITKLSSWSYIIENHTIEIGRRVERLDTSNLTKIELNIIAINNALRLIPKDRAVIIYTKSIKLKDYMRSRADGIRYMFLAKDLRHAELLSNLEYMLGQFSLIDIRVMRGGNKYISTATDMAESMIRSRETRLTIHFPTEAEYREWFNEHTDYIVDSIEIIESGVRVEYYVPSAILFEEKQLEQNRYHQESLFDGIKQDKKANSKTNEQKYVVAAFGENGKLIGFYGKRKLAYGYNEADTYTANEAFKKAYYLNKNSDMNWKAIKKR